MSLILHAPDVSFAPSFLAGLDELDDDDERESWICLRGGPLDLPRRDFAGYVAALRASEHTVPEGRVRETITWAIRDGAMIGRLAFRHELNEALMREGGHIGFIVRPSARRQGVATEMLRLALLTERARRIGKILVTCDDDNHASEKAIRSNGGAYEDTLDGVKRFWIALG